MKCGIFYTVKLMRAKLPRNAGNFTCGPHVKRPYMQFTCITCSSPVKMGNFTCVCGASTSRRIHMNCLQPHVNLLEYSGYFTGNFKCGTHANLSATGMQNCLHLQAKNLEIAGKNTQNCRQKHRNCRQSAITSYVNSPAKCT